MERKSGQAAGGVRSASYHGAGGHVSGRRFPGMGSFPVMTEVWQLNKIPGSDTMAEGGLLIFQISGSDCHGKKNKKYLSSASARLCAVAGSVQAISGVRKCCML